MPAMKKFCLIPRCRSTMRIAAGICMAVLGCCNGAWAQLTLTEVTRFNLDAITSATTTDGSENTRYVGNNVNSVAWDGSRLFVAGFVNSGQGGLYDNEGIIEITNTATTGIVGSTAVQYGSRFGYYPGVNSRGYTGLARAAAACSPR